MTTHKSFCRFCHVMCGIEVDVEGGKAIKVRGDRDNPMTQGFSCIKGRSLPDQLDHQDRLRESYVRNESGALIPISVSAAQDEIAGKLSQLIADHGPRSVALYAGTACYQSSFTLPFARAWTHGLGSPSFYSSLSIDQPNKIIAPQLHGWFMGGTHSFDSSDTWMLFGCNSIISMYGGTTGFPSCNPTQRVRDALARGLDLIVVDPRRTEIARMAGLHLPVRPGEDAALLAGMIRVILEERLYDQDFCDRFVEGMDELHSSVVTGGQVSSDWVERRTGLDWALVQQAARRFAGAARGVASSGTGPSMAPRPNLSELLILDLNTLCGRYNRAGDRIANPGVLTPTRQFLEQAMSPFAGFRTEPKSRIRGLGQVAGELPTAALSDEILTPGEGQVRALLVMGGNPALSLPDQVKTERALSSLELLVVVDPYVTATADLAHYVIAPTLCLERPDTTLFMDTWYPEPYAMYTPKLVDGPEAVVAEWDFLWGLARRMGTPIRLSGGPVEMETRPTADELLANLSSYARIALDEIKQHPGGGLFEGEPVLVEPGDPNSEARLRVFPVEIAAEFGDLLNEPLVEGAGYRVGESFTHRLISRRLRDVFNSMGRELPAIRKKLRFNPAYMNPEDLEELGVTNDDIVEIDSGHGQILAVVQAADDVPSGVISMAHSWGDRPSQESSVRERGSATSRLIDNTDHYDPISGMALQSAIPVNVKLPRSA